MGFQSDTRSQSEELLDQQLQNNQMELEAKKANLYKTRLDIIKSQGGQSWKPDKSSPLGANNGKGFKVTGRF